ncbi:MAG: RNA 2',3'-cyclic phosphodiesterase [Sumerlaeia bacterium]
MTQAAQPHQPQSDERETWRVFIALQLSGEVLEALTDRCRRLESAARFMPLRINWVNPENFHLTLHFLGPIPRIAVGTLAKNLSSAIAGIGPVALDVRHIGYFPHDKAPRVFWAGIHRPPGALAGLRASLERMIRRAGLEVPAVDYQPHITLARFKSLRGTGAFTKVAAQTRYEKFGVSQCSRVVLYRSQIDPAGAGYTELAAAELKPLPQDEAPAEAPRD